MTLRSRRRRIELNIVGDSGGGKMQLRLSAVIKESIVDGPGMRYVVFAQGCPHKCVGCHNPKTHDFSGGFDVFVEDILKDFDSNPFLDGITLSGGEPFSQSGVMLELAKGIKARGKTVVAYSGWTYDELVSLSEKDRGIKKLLNCVDILIDGRYEETSKDLRLVFRGSKNQSIVDVVKSMECGMKYELSFD